MLPIRRTLLNKLSALALTACLFAASLQSAERSMVFSSPTTGAEHAITLYLPAETKGETRLALYAHNLAASQTWSNSNAVDPSAMKEQLLAKGFAVGLLDYQGHEKAVRPDLYEDGIRLAHKKFFAQAGKALGAKVSEIFIIPAGYTLTTDVHMYTSPDNGLEVFATVVHPIRVDQAVPLLMRFNSAGSWSGGLLAGSEWRGYARAWVGHPFNFDGTRGIFPKAGDGHEKNLAYGQSAVRTMRARAAEFNVDPSRIGAHGASKHGNISVWVGVTGNHPVDHQRFGGLHPEVSGALQFVAAEATFGFAEHLVEDQAPKQVFEWIGWQGDGQPPQDWMLERSWTTYLSDQTPPMALTRCHGGHWRTEQVKRLIHALAERGIPMTQSLDKELPHYDGRRGRPGWYELADNVLKPQVLH